jgi:hypothetical protein
VAAAESEDINTVAEAAMFHQVSISLQNVSGQAATTESETDDLGPGLSQSGDMIGSGECLLPDRSRSTADQRRIAGTAQTDDVSVFDQIRCSFHRSR